MNDHKQTIIPGSLSEADVAKVWEDFLSQCKWMTAPGNVREREIVQARLERLRRAQSILTARIASNETVLAGMTDRTEAAKAFLDEAVKKLGKFGSPSVLIQILRENFPKLSRKQKTETRTETAPEETPETELGQGKLEPKPKYTDADKADVLSVLDREGLRMVELTKITGKDAFTLRAILEHLRLSGVVRTEGVRVARKYMLVSKDSQS